jgi:hypothetical protein
MSTGRCVSVILVGENHEENSRRREILNTIKHAEKKYNIPTCYFYEGPIEGYFDMEGLFNTRPRSHVDADDVFVFPLEPALEISGEGKKMYIRQNPPSVITDLLYALNELQSFSPDSDKELLYNRIVEVERGIPINDKKREQLFNLNELIKSYSRSHNEKIYQVCEEACQDAIDMLLKYLDELKKNPEYHEIIKNVEADLHNSVDPMIKLEDLRNNISMTTLKDKLYRDEINCQVAIIIVGNDHLSDYQTKIASSTGDNVCLHLIKTIDSTTNIQETSFQESINKLFIPLVEVTPIDSEEGKTDNFGGRSKRYKSKRYKSKRYKSKRYKSKRYKSKRYKTKRYKTKRYKTKRYKTKR